MTDRTFVVRRRNGSEYVVVVDAEDFDRVTALTWGLDHRGYVTRSRRGEGGMKLHRFVLGLNPGDPMVDHRDGDKLNNRKENLRLSTPVENGANLAEVNNRGKSRYRGVTWHASSGKWRAEARVNRKSVSLGLHATEEDALEALRRFRDA